MKRKASAVWQGNLMDGKGVLSSTSGVLVNTPYSFSTRFQNEDGKEGTNPEELIGAAHAGCFSMALSFILATAGHTPTEIRTEATVVIELVVDHFEIRSIHLDVVGDVPGMSQEKFVEFAEQAKTGCPVSMALKAVPITMTAKLK